MELEYEYGNTQVNDKKKVNESKFHLFIFTNQLTKQQFIPFLQDTVDRLATFGHKMVRFDYRGAVVCAISKNATGIYANADYRKEGEVAGL